MRQCMAIYSQLERLSRELTVSPSCNGEPGEREPPILRDGPRLDFCHTNHQQVDSH